MKGIDSVPLGDLLAATNACGIPVDEVVRLLRGTSPASVAPPALTRVADAVRGSGVRPRSLDDVRAASPEAAAALEAFLREHGTCVVTGYDVDGKCLEELPDVVTRSIMAVVDNPTPAVPTPPAEAVRSLFDRIPPEQRAEVEERFALAHAAYGVRDQNGPLTFQWPLGLLRRAMIDMGRRLHARGLLDEVEHAIELETRELRALFLGTDPALRTTAATRAALRREQARMRPPALLGAPPEPAPLGVMPASLARGVRAIEAFLAAMTGVRKQRQPLRGIGIGSVQGHGRAVLAHSPEEAFERLEPGDILVTTCTTPAYNAVLPIVGGIVTQEGGELSHAAIVARELGIPAIVGVVDVMGTIQDGEHVELDAAAGTIAVKREPVLAG
jgi:phosphohistidine swiveling domain-containing protein